MGCGGGATRATHVEAPYPMLQAAACVANVFHDGAGHRGYLAVNGVRVGSDDELALDDLEVVAPVVYPHTDTTIFVAWAATGRGGEYLGSPKLYDVPCDAPARASVFASVAGASFGHGAMTGDGKTLYFSGPAGVQALDIPTRAIRAVTTAPRSHGCSADKQMRDIVTAFDDAFESLTIERAGSCDVNGEWAHATYVLDKGATTVRPARPVTAIAVDPAGRWWAGADGTVWTSTDRGAHWTRGTLRAESGPFTVAIDRAGHVLVQTLELEVMAAPAIGGYLFATRDGGATWHEIALPAEITHDRESDPLDRPHGAHDRMGLAFAIGESIDTITLWGTAATWHTDDAGAHWTRIATTEPPPRPEAHDGTWALGPSPDGLIVDDGHIRPRVVFIGP